jgi:hypothetical protein
MPDIQPQIRRVREVLGALVRASGSKLTPIERQIGPETIPSPRIHQGGSAKGFQRRVPGVRSTFGGE